MPTAAAAEALLRLQAGNRRFVEKIQSTDHQKDHPGRAELVAEQEPFAIILGCSDSRVPAEIVFDQGLGDLFVIRVAGGVVAPSQIGSIEFAVEMFGCRLVVVLGHSRCGAVSATLAELVRPSENRSPNLAEIVDRIRPSVQTLLETDLKDDPERLLSAAVRANTRASADHLRHGSKILERAVAEQGLRIVTAEYLLESGVVEFFDGGIG